MKYPHLSAAFREKYMRLKLEVPSYKRKKLHDKWLKTKAEEDKAFQSLVEFDRNLEKE